MGEMLSYLTTDEAAKRLGVSRERVGFWIKSGKLPVAARSNIGFLLSAETVDRLGPELAAGAPAFPWSKGRGSRRKKAADPAPVALPCGCVTGRSFCRHGAILSAAVQLAEGFAIECDTPTYRHLARLTREALDEHLRQEPMSPAEAGRAGADELRQEAQAA
jgi:excisionase family DNA binding protein